MNLLAFFSLLLIHFMANVLASESKSVSGSNKASGIRGISSRFLHDINEQVDVIGAKDMKSFQRYFEKLTEAAIEFETSTSSQKTKSKTISDAFEKYSEKLKNLILNLTCSPGEQVAIYGVVERFLIEFKDIFDDEKSRMDRDFMEALKSYPEGSLPNHYLELWRSLNTYSEHDFDQATLAGLIGRASDTYQQNFRQSFHEDIARPFADDPEMIAGIIRGIYDTSLRCGLKIDRIVKDAIDDESA